MIPVKKRLDAVLGSITMYKLVLGLLLLLGVYSIVLSMLGIVSYSPLEIILTWAVAVLVSLGSSWLFGRIFRTHAHLESAAITGLLLLFVLPPTAEPFGLVWIALAALIASASKYLLAVRGRHIFNPAALGALVVTATGLTFSGWWVSNVYLLPVVALGALAILYRTRRLAMGLLFVLAVLVFTVARTLLTGSPTDPIGLALLGTATVFFAGFMLSEPLTLPPRRWQQLVLAVVVAALFAIPFNVAEVLYSSPQLALVVGNLLAFLVGQRRGLALSLVAKKQLTPTTWEFAFQPKHPVRFRAGQYLELALPHGPADLRGQRRVFSISSAPSPDAPITVGVKVSERSSSFKTAMLALEPGDRVRATSVGGDFLLPSDATTPVLLVAGGIGITPFASQLAHEAGRGRDTVVVYAVSAGEELAYRTQLEASDARVIVIAPTAPEDLPADWTYAGPDRLSAEALANLVPDLSSRHAFISGPPALVDDVRGILRSLKARRISTDYFSGY
jgi:ferredoxin-NADP reductase/Na+-translocating ferredoxin:NAD+ oxidoreductase RnfD subunit